MSPMIIKKIKKERKYRTLDLFIDLNESLERKITQNNDKNTEARSNIFTPKI